MSVSTKEAARMFVGGHLGTVTAACCKSQGRSNRETWFYSYSTVIGVRRHNGEILLSSGFYSRSSSHHRNCVSNAARQQVTWVETLELPQHRENPVPSHDPYAKYNKKSKQYELPSPEPEPEDYSDMPIDLDPKR